MHLLPPLLRKLKKHRGRNKMTAFELPWPPSVNHYYRHVGPRVLISREGKTYRETVAARLRGSGVQMYSGAVELSIQLYPPDNRRRDIDNVLKVLLDTLTIGGVYADDSQIKKLSITMRESAPNGGFVYLRINNYVSASQ